MKKPVRANLLLHPNFKTVFDQCPAQRFQRIDNLPGLLNAKAGYTVVMHLQKSIAGLEALADTVDLSWIKIHYLQSLKVLCGYAFELPSLNITVQPTMIKIYKPPYHTQESFTEVQVQFSNAHFTVFNSQDHAMLIVQNSEHKLD